MIDLLCMGAHRHGQEGALASLWKYSKVFLCISSYSKTLSRRFIYALFSKTVLASGASPLAPTRALSLDSTGGLSSPDSYFAHPWKNFAGAYASVR